MHLALSETATSNWLGCRGDVYGERKRPTVLFGVWFPGEGFGKGLNVPVGGGEVGWTMSAFEKPQIIAHIQKGLNYTVFDCKWMPCSAKFVTMGNFARGTGVIQLYEIQHGDLKLLREIVQSFQGPNQKEKQTSGGLSVTWEIEKAKPIKCGTFGATSLQQRYLATGDFAGNLHIWNLEAPEYPVYSVKAHKEIINTIDGVGGLGIGEGAPEIVTGSRDGTVKVWDPRQKDDPVANMEPVQGENKRDCWTVAFGNAYNQEERVVCAGYDNGDIKLFDLRNMSLRWETNIKNGVCSLEFDRKDISMNKLVATSLEGKFHVFDMRTQHPTKGFASVSEKAHKSTVWQVRHLPQNRELFLTAGGAGALHLWKYEYPAQRSKKDSEGVEMGVAGSVSLLQNVTLSTQPISSMDWSPDKRGLCICSSFDQMVRVLIITKLNKV
ncbi:dynein axonemal assembly factor 10 isoform X1 [Pipistrellus kuhlii]|uniref:dynein axonemal assembly factor 10 isoform X1 n=2 Tax=Pipistrellus kuhlii TaxID=59472 RepID=UPI001E271CED|nr:dynein axonemal assembly factor 10 isoform X1 [Pipistrellus kuhlii]